MLFNQLALRILYEENGSLHGQGSQMLREQSALAQLLPEAPVAICEVI